MAHPNAPHRPITVELPLADDTPATLAALRRLVELTKDAPASAPLVITLDEGWNPVGLQVRIEGPA